MPVEDEMLPVGVMGKAHGIKGEIFMDWHAEAPLPKDQVIYLKNNNTALMPYKVLADRVHKDRHLISLEGITNRNEAELLKGQTVFISKKNLPPLSDEEAYLHDLTGCDVLLTDGTYVGKLDHVEFPANQQIWSIVDDNKREILFPAQPCFIAAVDPANHKIIIEPPDGLLDIYRA